MKNHLKAAMLNGQKVLGTFNELGSEIAIECLCSSGLDFIIIDSEHGPFDVESVQRYIRAAKNTQTTPLVRVKDSNRNSILKMLDVGAMGLIIPNVHSVEEVKEIVRYGKFFPVGQRGVAATAGSRFWTEDYATQGLDHYFAVNNSETLLIPQCETRGSLEAIEEIVAIEGVDGIFIGPYDLSTALGKPGQFSDPEVSGGIKRVLQACKDAGKFAFIYAGSEADTAKNFELGFDAVALGLDAVTLINAFKDIVQRVKS